MMNTDFIKGVIVPILMPIDKEEEINEKALRRQTDYVIDGGVSGILLFGSNGEFYALDPKEQEQALEIVVDQTDGRVPVYAGIGAVTTRQCVRLAQMAYAGGAQGISLLQPMYISPGEDELFGHYMAVAEAVPDMPVLIYNNPRAGYGIKPALGIRIAKEAENVVGIKDSGGDITQLCEYIRLSREMDFKVLVGKDTMIMPGLAAGAAGCVATTANFLPNFVCDIYNRYMEGDFEGAREAQYRLTPIRNALDLASFPAGTKDIANLMGMAVGAPYLPNKSSFGERLEKMQKILQQEGII